jgi:DDE superfamily endonuclease/Winged helix-turn helix
MITALVDKKYGIKLSKTSVGRFLNQLAFTAHRPLWRACEQDPEAVDKRLEDEFLAITRATTRCEGEIYFGDQARICSAYNSGTECEAKSQTPVLGTTGALFGFNMISAISPKLRFMVVEGIVGADQFIEFLKRLVLGTKRRVFIMVDGLPPHRAKVVRSFVEHFNPQTLLHLLPGYSSELYPGERVWRSPNPEIWENFRA